MKILSLIIVLVLMHPLIFCQNILIEFDVNGNESKSKCKLIITDSITVWQNESDSSAANDFSFFIKNHAGNSVYSNERFASKEFYVKDSLHSMRWVLTNDTAIILNEKCFAAKTYFRGRNYTAYYATSYPISDGPWKFGGLPGLILKIKSDDNYIQWTATKIIKNYQEGIKIPKISHIKFLYWNEYVKEYMEIIDRWGKLARSNGTINEGVDLKIKINAVEIIYPKAQLGDGISF